MRVINGSEVVASALNELGVESPKMFEWAKTLLPDAVKELGYVPSYSIMYELYDNPKEELLYPKHYIETRHIFTVKGDDIEEGYYGGAQPRDLFQHDSARSFYNPSSYNGAPLFGEDGSSLFFMAGKPENYDKVILVYYAWKHDDRGCIMVPEKGKLACMKYIQWKTVQRQSLNKEGGNPIHQSTINAYRDDYYSQLGNDKGNMRLPTMLESEMNARERKSNILRTIKALISLNKGKDQGASERSISVPIETTTTTTESTSTSTLTLTADNLNQLLSTDGTISKTVVGETVRLSINFAGFDSDQISEGASNLFFGSTARTSLNNILGADYDSESLMGNSWSGTTAASFPTNPSARTLFQSLATAIDNIVVGSFTPDRYFTPEQYNAAHDGVTDDSSAIQQALDAIQENEGGTLWLFPGAVYACDESIWMKRWDTTYRPKQIVIQGNGATLKATSNNITLLGSQIVDQADASLQILTRVKIEDIYFDGSGTTGVTGIKFYAHYTSVIQDCFFDRCDTCVEAVWCLNVEYNRLMFQQPTSYGLVHTKGTTQWTGATGAFSQGNGSTARSCRIYAGVNTVASFLWKDADQCKMIDCICEGNGPQYNVIIDDESTTFRAFLIDNIWFENQVQNSHVYIADTVASNDLHIHIKWPRLQTATSKTLVDASNLTGTSPTVTIDGFAYLANDVGVKTATRQTPLWVFKNLNSNMFAQNIWNTAKSTSFWKDNLPGRFRAEGQDGRIVTSEMFVRPDNGIQGVGNIDDVYKGSMYVAGKGRMNMNFLSRPDITKNPIPAWQGSGFGDIGDASSPLLTDDFTINMFMDWGNVGRVQSEAHSENVLQLFGESAPGLKDYEFRLFNNEICTNGGIVGPDSNEIYAITNMSDFEGFFIMLTISITGGTLYVWVNGQVAALEHRNGSRGTDKLNRIYNTILHNEWGAVSTQIHKIQMFNTGFNQADVDEWYAGSDPWTFDPTTHTSKSGNLLMNVENTSTDFGPEGPIVDSDRYFKWSTLYDAGDPAGSTPANRLYEISLKNWTPPFEPVPTRFGDLCIFPDPHYGYDIIHKYVYKSSAASETIVIADPYSGGSCQLIWEKTDALHTSLSFSAPSGSIKGVSSPIDVSSYSVGDILFFDIMTYYNVATAGWETFIKQSS